MCGDSSGRKTEQTLHSAAVSGESSRSACQTGAFPSGARRTGLTVSADSTITEPEAANRRPEAFPVAMSCSRTSVPVGSCGGRRSV